MRTVHSAVIYFFSGLALAFALFSAIVGIRWQYFIQHPLQIPEDGLHYVVKPGISFKAFASDLSQKGIISHPRFFIWLAKLRGQANKLQSGEYLLPIGTTPSQLLEQITNGNVVQHPFLIVEGMTFSDVAQRLRGLSDIRHVPGGLNQQMIADKLGLIGKLPEGYFFPDTYFYSSTTTDLEILEKAHQKMLHVLYDAWSKRVRDLPYHSPYEALVMASLIEKETANAEERPRIAGVLINRLRQHMYLQVDPTVIYGMGVAYHGELKHDDLAVDTPYNTYLHKGLPVTPIALPSKASIIAALNPVETKELYYVANGDGTHTFSRTLQDHNKAVQNLLKSSKDAT